MLSSDNSMNNSTERKRFEQYSVQLDKELLYEQVCACLRDRKTRRHRKSELQI